MEKASRQNTNHRIPEQKLDSTLGRFYAEVRKKDGQEYEPESLAVMQRALDRHLKKLQHFEIRKIP